VLCEPRWELPPVADADDAEATPCAEAAGAVPEVCGPTVELADVFDVFDVLPVPPVELVPPVVAVPAEVVAACELQDAVE
jgi:hypothetical protein